MHTQNFHSDNISYIYGNTYITVIKRENRKNSKYVPLTVNLHVIREKRVAWSPRCYNSALLLSSSVRNCEISPFSYRTYFGIQINQRAEGRVGAKRRQRPGLGPPPPTTDRLLAKPMRFCGCKWSMGEDTPTFLCSKDFDWSPPPPPGGRC